MIRLEMKNYNAASKIPALSSGNIEKYEYLTGEDILPSNQQQIIEQAKFTYSPLGKAFEKQIKTIEDQGKKQNDALENVESKAIESGSNNNKPIITQEIHEKILAERMSEILNMRDETDFSNLTYNLKGPTAPVNFDKFKDPIYIYDYMKNSDTILQQVENEQKDLKKKIK